MPVLSPSLGSFRRPAALSLAWALAWALAALPARVHAAPTPTPTPAWGAQKQLDPFAATAQFYTQYNPAGAGSSLALSVDGAVFATGTSSVRADYAFNAVAGGNFQVERGYGTQTLDLSFRPWGLSFWVKGSAPGDTVQLLLYENLAMDGNPYGAGDQVFSSAPLAIPAGWTQVVLPYSAFGVYAGSGDNNLHLNRIYGWQIDVANPLGSAHSASVWLDDLEQLTTYAPAADSHAVLQGSFIQLWNAGSGCGCGQWNLAQWTAALSQLQSLCQDTVIVQYGVYDSTAWYTPTAQPFVSASYPALNTIFQAAQALGMKVVVGLYFGDTWDTDDKTQAATYTGIESYDSGVAAEIAGLFGSSPSFGGWYIPQEVDDLQWQDATPQLALLQSFLQSVAAGAKYAKSAPVYIAPFFGPNRPADDYQSWWTATLAAAPSVDWVLPQDGVGTTRTNVFVDVPPYFAALAAAAAAEGRGFGGTLESFRQTGGWPVNTNPFSSVPTDIGTFQHQLWESHSAGASFLVQFDYSNMEPGLGAAQSLLESNYQAYESTEAPCGASPTPTASATATPSSSATATSSETPSPTRTPSPTETPSPTGTPSSGVSPSPDSSPTTSLTPSPAQSPSSTPSPSASSSGTPAISVTASPTFSPFASASPSSTPSPAGSGSASPLPSPSETASGTRSPAPTATAAATVTATVTATAAATAAATATATATATVSPVTTGTAGATPLSTPTASATATSTPSLSPATLPSPAASGGASGAALQILRAVPVPNPNPRSLWLQLQGPADGVELRIYTQAFVIVGVLQGPGQSAGWNRLDLGSALGAGLPPGSYYLEVRARRGAAQSAWTGAKVDLLR